MHRHPHPVHQKQAETGLSEGEFLDQCRQVQDGPDQDQGQEPEAGEPQPVIKEGPAVSQSDRQRRKPEDSDQELPPSRSANDETSQTLATLAGLTFALLIPTGSAGAAVPQVELLKDLNPGPSGFNPYDLTPFGNSFLLSGKGGPEGNEPWLLNGSSASLIEDLSPGSDASEPNGFEVIGNTAYFVASTAATGSELFRTGRKLGRDRRGPGSRTRQFQPVLPEPDGGLSLLPGVYARHGQ